MKDTAFFIDPEKVGRVAVLHQAAEDHTLRRAPETPITNGTLVYSATYPYQGPRTYFSGGAGLTSTAGDYARFLQMLLNGGDLDGARVLKPETVRSMTTNQITEFPLTLGSIHGDRFGLGFGVVMPAGKSQTPMSVGSYGWGGFFHTIFWVDPEKKLIGVLMTQVHPASTTIQPDFIRASYEAAGGLNDRTGPTPRESAQTGTVDSGSDGGVEASRATRGLSICMEGDRGMDATTERDRVPGEILAQRGGDDGWSAPWVAWATLGFVAVGVALRVVRYLLNYPLWCDETMLAANFLDRSYADMLGTLDYRQVSPLLFRFVMLTSVRVFGFSEMSLRLFPFLCGVGSVFLFRHVAGRVTGGVPLMLAMAIFAVAAWPLRYAAEVKPYASDFFVAAQLLALAIEWRRDPGRVGWLWALAAVARWRWASRSRRCSSRRGSASPSCRRSYGRAGGTSGSLMSSSVWAR